MNKKLCIDCRGVEIKCPRCGLLVDEEDFDYDSDMCDNCVMEESIDSLKEEA